MTVFFPSTSPHLLFAFCPSVLTSDITAQCLPVHKHPSEISVAIALNQFTNYVKLCILTPCNLPNSKKESISLL